MEIKLEDLIAKRNACIAALDESKTCATCKNRKLAAHIPPCNKCYNELLGMPVDPTNWETK